MNRDGTGWNLYSSPCDDTLFGRGNNGTWAQFYIEKGDNHYYIASYHSLNTLNMTGGFGRYIGVSNHRLACNMHKCSDSAWIIQAM
jgi:hypothetical protein